MSNLPTTTSTGSSETTASSELPPSDIAGGLTANVEAISDLFSREPDTWTPADMERAVAEYRKRRKELDAQPADAKPKREKKEKPKPISAADGADLLSKLGL